jgi:hypothetical protein
MIFPVPKSNSEIVAQGAQARRLVEQLATGETVILRFRPVFEREQTISFPLDGFRGLVDEASEVGLKPGVSRPAKEG